MANSSTRHNDVHDRSNRPRAHVEEPITDAADPLTASAIARAYAEVQLLHLLHTTADAANINRRLVDLDGLTRDGRAVVTAMEAALGSARQRHGRPTAHHVSGFPAVNRGSPAIGTRLPSRPQRRLHAASLPASFRLFLLCARGDSVHRRTSTV